MSNVCPGSVDAASWRIIKGITDIRTVGSVLAFTLKISAWTICFSLQWGYWKRKIKKKQKKEFDKQVAREMVKGRLKRISEFYAGLQQTSTDAPVEYSPTKQTLFPPDRLTTCAYVFPWNACNWKKNKSKKSFTSKIFNLQWNLKGQHVCNEFPKKFALGWN